MCPRPARWIWPVAHGSGQMTPRVVPATARDRDDLIEHLSPSLFVALAYWLAYLRVISYFADMVNLNVSIPSCLQFSRAKNI